MKKANIFAFFIALDVVILLAVAVFLALPRQPETTTPPPPAQSARPTAAQTLFTIRTPELFALLDKRDFIALHRQLQADYALPRPAYSLAPRLDSYAWTWIDRHGDGDWVRAIDDYVDAYPESVVPRLLRMHVHFHLGWHARGEALAKDVDPWRFNSMRAHFAQASLDAKAALALDPQAIEASETEVLIARHQDRNTLDAAFAAAIERHPEHPDLVDLYQAYLFGIGVKWGGEPGEDLAFARAAAKTHPNDARIGYLVVLAHREDANAEPGKAGYRAYLADPVIWREITEATDRVLAAFQGYSFPALATANIAYYAARRDDAARYWKIAVDRDAYWGRSSSYMPVHALRRLGEYALKKGNAEAARNYFSRYIALYGSDDPAGFAGLGDAYHRQRNFAAAETEMAKALALAPDSARYEARYCHALYYNYHYQQALPHCDRAIELDPKMAWAYEVRGHTHKQLGHAELAKQDLATYESLR